jgi:hypothetical protein
MITYLTLGTRCFFFSADLKHAYLTIPMHPDDRHYFAFSISGIGQVQPTRVQQGSKSAGFTMTELVCRAFGPLPSPAGPETISATLGRSASFARIGVLHG